MMLGVRYESLYRLLGRPVLGSSGFMDSDSVSESWQVAHERELISGTQSSSETLKGLNMHELTRWILMRVCSLLGACIQFVE
jgi:hypothetical protein